MSKYVITLSSPIANEDGGVIERIADATADTAAALLDALVPALWTGEVLQLRAERANGRVVTSRCWDWNRENAGRLDRLPITKGNAQ